MNLCKLLFFITLFILPYLFFAQPETDTEEIAFALVDKADGHSGDVLFLNNAKYKDTYQYDVANSIFEKLIEARGDFRMQKPTLKISKAERNGAFTKPRKAEIFLELKAYDICASFGKDSLNALAALLSHELIHYYEKHSWTKHFASEHGDTGTGAELKKYKERLKLEAQSDYLGGFLAYSAGYKTLDIMPQFLEKVYKGYRLKDTLRGYPPLQERKDIATKALEKLQGFIHVFETANYLTALEQYEPAKLYFDYILKDFQSREIYNNVGVIASQIGIQFVRDEFLKYGLPLELDVESRLKNGIRGNKEKELGKKVLEEAIDYFDKASKLDQNYPISLLNMACVYFLLNNFEDAEYFARKALKRCDQPKWEKTKSDVYVLQGILADYQDDPKRAEMLFQKAAETGNMLAKSNLGILKNESLAGANISVSGGASKDQIDNFSIDRAVGQLLKGELKVDEMIKISKTNTCGTKQLDNSTLFIHFIDDNNYAFIQIADDAYVGKTSTGIQTNSPAKEIFATYGSPDRSIEISNGSYLVYYNKNLLFLMNDKGMVNSWGVFKFKDKN